MLAGFCESNEDGVNTVLGSSPLLSCHEQTAYMFTQGSLQTLARRFGKNNLFELSSL